MLDHMLDQLLFPLVLWPSFASAQNPFPLKYDTSAQGTWRDGLPMNIYMLWEFHEPRVQGTFRMGKPEHACLPIPIYRLLRSFHHENLRFNGSFTKLRRWTIQRKQSCRCINSLVYCFLKTNTPQSLWPLSQRNLGGCTSWMLSTADQASKVCWTDNPRNQGFMVQPTHIP